MSGTLPLTRQEFEVELVKATSGGPTGSKCTQDRIIKLLEKNGIKLFVNDTEKQEQEDITDQPGKPYYNGDDVMKIIERYNLGFCLGNVIKYTLRAGNKPSQTKESDLRKALWYLERELSNGSHLK